MFLGRPTAPRDVVDLWLGNAGAELVTALLLSDAFRVDIAEPLQQQTKAASWISHASLSPALTDWVKSYFCVGQYTSQRLSRPQQWPVVLDILFHDPNFLQFVGQSAPQWADKAFLASLSGFANPFEWPDALQRDYDTLVESKAFDTAYYLARYQDIGIAGVDPIGTPDIRCVRGTRPQC